MVADASALVEYLLRTGVSSSIESVIRGRDADLHVPSLCDVDVTSGIRSILNRGRLSEERAAQALSDYLDLPVTRHGHQSLLGRILGLRDNFSAYDATYVALAERLDGTLLTADERLRRAVHAQTSLTTL